jgi:colicin import membrane protein
MLPTSNGDLRLWLGSVALHVLFVVVIAVAAMRWRAEPPMPQLAIEGSIVRYEDLPAAARAGRPLPEPSTESSTPPPEPKPVKPEPVAEPPPPRQEIAKEQAPTAKEQAAAAKARAAAAKEQARETAAKAESKRTEQQRAADARAKAAAEQQQKAETKRKQEAAAAQQQQEQAKAEREAKLKSAREAKLQAALADEEAGAAIAQSGVIDEYRALLVQTIQRNWRRPDTAQPGLECTLYVTQATGGTVLDVKLGDCNGDAAVRESVTNAVYRSSPLPAPRDARAFERRLVIVFKPTE